jgi:hypothetical protein
MPIQTATTERENIELQDKIQLQENRKSVGGLSSKLQEAEAHPKELQFKYDHELQAEGFRLTRAILDGNKTQIASRERIYKKNLASVKSGCDRRVLAAEEKRLAELAELERKIQKCDEDWTAERKSVEITAAWISYGSYRYCLMDSITSVIRITPDAWSTVSPFRIRNQYCLIWTLYVYRCSHARRVSSNLSNSI